MKNILKSLSLILAFLMLATPLVACKTSTPPDDSETESRTESSESASVGEDTEQAETEIETIPGIAAIENEYTPYIEHANALKNGVNPYYTDASRAEVTVDNKVMSLGYGMVGGSGNMQISHLSNTQGKSYITDTMDIILNYEDGKRFYASRSKDGAILNIHRYGYYYYETRIEGQTFMNELVAEKELVIDPNSYDYAVGVKRPEAIDGVLTYRAGAEDDPRLCFNTDFAAQDYEYLEITMRLSQVNGNSQIFIISGSHTSYNPEQCYTFAPTAGEDFVTYLIPLSDSFNDYSGTVSGIRFDINVPSAAKVEIKSIRVFKASYQGAPETLSLQRSFHTYSNKLHHLLQLSTTTAISGIASVEMVTRIDQSTVSALVIKDKNGLKNTLDGVDRNSVEYVGFDIKDAGVFGFILPAYEGSGSLSVTLEGGVYTVTQIKTPQGGKLIPSAAKTANADDFYMGCRIYNDETHSFDAFIGEAEIERHPLTAENISVDEGYDSAAFEGYDPLRGCYVFTLSGTNFNKAFYVHPNKQFRVNFTVKGDDKDRNAYFMTHMSNNGGLECAVLLGKGNLLLPIPMEVCKNFGSDGDVTIFDIDDTQYSETYFPMSICAGVEKEYTVVHAYQNWGIFPVKQISSIEYHTPFYHLSTGVTETNCIVPFAEAGPGLPDHRAMSAPFWPTQPQHTSGGSHNFLFFSNEEDKMVISNTTYATIDSYGPTYADINLGFITADNRIKANYTHMEMPQTDENRTYYEFSYTFLEDIRFDDFAHDFKFYRCTDNNATGTYTKIGYLNPNNECKVVDAVSVAGQSKDYVLGDNCPYFSFFDMKDAAPDSTTAYGYVNLSFLIHSAEIICNGEKITPNFIIVNTHNFISLSLDMDEVTFKKGDTIRINAMLMPWGSQELDYSGDEPDANVRRVRENTLLSPLTATADENCSVLDSVYLPKLRSTDGKSATFTLSGGHNNVSCRVYGFERLTAPKIEEFVDGEWKPYKTASINAPDAKGYGYHYDGYMVHYDEDGSYSYSFVVAMDNGAPRKFRISATEEFTAWPKVEYDKDSGGINAENDPINVYVDADELNSFADDAIGYVSGLELLEDDDGTKFVRYYANSGAVEGFITPFKAANEAYIDLESTGQYAVFKYRLPSDIPIKLKNLQFYTSTLNETPQGPEKCEYYDLKYDDKWHVIILDLSKMIPSPNYNANEDGVYKAKFFRIDIFNMSGLTEDVHIDLAYVGLSDSLQEIYELNKDMDEVTLVTNTGSDRIDPTTGTTYNGTPLNVYIAPDTIAAASANLSLNRLSLADDGSYVRLEAAVGSKYEAFATLYSLTNPMYEKLESTGQYVVFKYRLPADASVKLNALEIFTSTENPSPQGPDNTDYYMPNHDGEWHVVVMDIAKLLPQYCIADAESGKYLLQFLRFDFFSANIGGEIYLDLAYIGICDDMKKICEFNSDMDHILLVESIEKETAIDTKTGNPINN